MLTTRNEEKKQAPFEGLLKTQQKKLENKANKLSKERDVLLLQFKQAKQNGAMAHLKSLKTQIEAKSDKIRHILDLCFEIEKYSLSPHSSEALEKLYRSARDTLLDVEGIQHSGRFALFAVEKLNIQIRSATGKLLAKLEKEIENQISKKRKL